MLHVPRLRHGRLQGRVRLRGINEALRKGSAGTDASHAAAADAGADAADAADAAPDAPAAHAAHAAPPLQAVR